MKPYIRKLFLLLLFIVFILLVMHFLTKQFAPAAIHIGFNLDGEANIPTWYSTVLLFSIGLCALFIYHLKNSIIDRNNVWQFFWLGFGAVYCFLSLDEAARFHELVDKFTSIKWVIIYAPFAVIFFLVCAYYLTAINKNRMLRNLILGGLFICAAGAFICESISHLFYPLPSVLQQVEYIVEEGFELCGTIMVLIGCLQELNTLYKNRLQSKV